MGKKKKSSRQRKRERRLKQIQEERHLPSNHTVTARAKDSSNSDKMVLASSSSSSPLSFSHLNQSKLNNNNNLSSSPATQQDKAEVLAAKTFGSRKRTLAEVQFVYPRQNGKIVPYNFGKQQVESKVKETTDESNTNETSGVKPRESTKETLEDILNFKKRNKASATDEAPAIVPVTDVHSSPTTKSKHENSSTTAQIAIEAKVNDIQAEDHDISKQLIARPRKGSIDYINESDLGHLSGRSVEDAVQDKIGCRPRSNSTDGELNLPRRGLCDERKVLESYKWGSSNDSTDNGTKNAFGRVNPRGFTNLGNTCYLNSTLQCLAYLPPFCQSLIALPASGSNNGQKKISQGKHVTMKLKALFRQVHGVQNESNGIKGSPKGAIMPRSIVESVPTLGSCGNRKGYRFRPGRQEDAHEFLVHLLDAMHDGELREAGLNQHVSGWRDRLPIPRLDETTFVHRVFGGYLRSQVSCTKCGHCSNTYDPFLNLSLEVSRKSCTSIATALGEFTRKETLDTNNRWKCSGCKKYVCATKQLTVFRPPLSLCIQLKRFTYSGLAGGAFGYGAFGRGGSKISKAIEFPADLKLPLSDGRSCGYSLSGIVIHVGSSASSGHYTAYVKKPCSNEWFHMDDSYVEQVSERSVLRQRDAYLLFYSRKEVKLEFPTPPLRSSMSAKEAQELGRARAKARADSITSISKKELQKEVAKQVPMVQNDSSEKDGLTATQKAVEQRDKASGEFAKSSFTPGDDQSVESSTSSSSESSDSRSSIDTSPSSPHASEEECGRDDRTKRKEDISSGEKNDAATRSMREGRNESPAKCENAATVDRTTVTNHPSIGEVGSDDEGKITKKSIAASEEKVLEAAPQKISDKVHSKVRTRIVLDRGEGKGKVEVMMGPRFKSKAWKPKTAIASKGSEFSLLGNLKVDAWDSDADDTEHPLKQDPTRIELMKQMERKEASRKRKMHLDRWDAALDLGKTKKIRKKETHVVSNSSNAFQKLQRHFQDTRGRVKGAHFK